MADTKKFFEDREKNWSAVLQRQELVEIEVPQWTEEGKPAPKYKVRKPPSWASEIWLQHNGRESTAMFCAGYIVGHILNYLGEPFFYSEKTKAGNDVSISEMIFELNQAKEKLVRYSSKEELAEIAEIVASSVNDIASITAEDVKEDSSPETES